MPAKEPKSQAFFLAWHHAYGYWEGPDCVTQDLFPSLGFSYPSWVEKQYRE